jgi:hypothetical protein
MKKALLAVGLIFACQFPVMAQPIFTPPKGGAPKQTKGAGSRKTTSLHVAPKTLSQGSDRL